MRIRQIKPEFWKSERLAELPRDVRMLFVGLWNMAESWGMLEDRPRRIKAELFPYDDDITAARVNEWLTLLATHAFVVRYQHNGIGLIYIPKFRDHQYHGMTQKERERQSPKEWKLPRNITIAGTLPAPSPDDDEQIADPEPSMEPSGDPPSQVPVMTMESPHGTSQEGIEQVPEPSQEGNGDPPRYLPGDLSGTVGERGNGVTGGVGGRARARRSGDLPPPARPDGPAGGEPHGGGGGEPESEIPARLAPLVAAGVNLDRRPGVLAEWLDETLNLVAADVAEILGTAPEVPRWPSDFGPLRKAYLERRRAERTCMQTEHIAAKSRAKARWLLGLIDAHPELIDDAASPTSVRSSVTLLREMIDAKRDCRVEIDYLVGSVAQGTWQAIIAQRAQERSRKAPLVVVEGGAS